MNTGKNLSKFNQILNNMIPKSLDLYYYLKFLKDKSYFIKLIENDEINKLKDILKNITIKKYEDNEIVFYQGDIAHDFYFIFKGKVDIFINNNSSNNEFSKEFYEKHRKNNKIYDSVKKKFIINKVFTIGEGRYFGELGIIDNKKRQASIITKLEYEKSIRSSILFDDDDSENDYIKYKNIMKSNKVILGIIKKENFISILKNQLKNEQDLEIKNLCNLFHKEFPFMKVKNMMPFFTKLELNKNKIIFQKNDIFKYIYIISKGEIKISENIIIKKLKNNELNSKNYEKYLKLKIQKSCNLNLNNQNFHYDIRILKQSDYLGINEYLNNLNTYKYNAKVISNKAIVYQLDISNMKNMKNNLELKEFFKKYFINFDNYFIRKNKLKNVWNKTNKGFNFQKFSIKNYKEKDKDKDNFENKKFYSRRLTNNLKLNINTVLNLKKNKNKKIKIKNFDTQKIKTKLDKRKNSSNTIDFLKSINCNYFIKNNLKKTNGLFSLEKKNKNLKQKSYFNGFEIKKYNKFKNLINN